uniref:Uncharacterized protein n=1 Tax=Caenorhabditis japonica TaxID=281687 RepID=A0A8R1EUQ0_CAEJA
MSARTTRTYRTFVAPRPPAHLRDLALPRHARHREVEKCGASAYTCSHVSVPLSRLLTLSTHCSPLSGAAAAVSRVAAFVAQCLDCKLLSGSTNGFYPLSLPTVC